MKENSGHDTNGSKIVNKLWNNNNNNNNNTNNNNSHLSIKKIVDDIQHMSILNGHKNDADKSDISGSSGSSGSSSSNNSNNSRSGNRLTANINKQSVSQDTAMYGRKGSVSLRIFHNDEDNDQNKSVEMIDERGNICDERTSAYDKRTSAYDKRTSTPTLEHSNKFTKPFINESYSVKLKSPLYHVFEENQNESAIDDNDEDSDEIVPSKTKDQTSVPNLSSSSPTKTNIKANTSTNTNTTSVNKRLLSKDYLFNEPDESNVVKRVSSATYIPHTVPTVGKHDVKKSLLSNETLGITSDILDHNTFATITNDQDNDTKKHVRLVGEKLPIMSDSRMIKDKNPIIQETTRNIDTKNNKDKEHVDNNQQYEFPLAVELKPFKNKVGGHTEIFKFSKRAVCKTLVNNENVWYENLEHLYATKEANEKHASSGENEKESHNILHYMPKYIGVLNVRQHFNTLNEYMEAVGELNHKNPQSKEGKGDTKRVTNEKQQQQQQQQLQCEKDSHRYMKKKPRCNSDTINEVVLDDNIHLFPSSFLNKINHVFSSSENQSTPTTSPVYGTSRSLMERRMSNQDISTSPWNKQIRRNSSSNNTNTLLSTSPSSTHSLNLTASNTEQIEMPKLQHSRSQSIIDDHFINTTMINTKLQEQVINEVFAPYKCTNLSHHNNNNNNNNNNDNINNINNALLSAHPHDSPRSNSRSNSNTIGSMRNSSSPSLSARRRRKSDSTSFSSKKYAQTHNLKQTITPPLKSKQSDCDNEEAALMSDELTLLPEPSLTKQYSNENHNSKIEYQNNNEPLDVFETEESKTTALQNEQSLHSPQNDYTVVSQFILLEDLTRNLENPCVLDLKMGTRQYGVMANVRKQKSQSLKCLKTTSKKLGCRVCGLKIWDPKSKTYLKKDKYFGRRIRIGWQFSRILARFLYNKQTITSILVKIPKLVKNLDNLNETIKFLKGYRLYGASLLFMYDGSKELSHCKIYLIDFAQCLTKQDFVSKMDSMECPPKTSIQWEDKGFCKGLKSLKFYLKAIWNHLTNNHELIYDDKQLLQYLETNKEIFQKNWAWLDEFDVEDEAEFNDENSKLRKKWMKDELLFDVEPPFENSEESS